MNHDIHVCIALGQTMTHSKRTLNKLNLPSNDISEVFKIEDLLRGLLLSVRILITCSSRVVKELSSGESEKHVS